MATERQSPDTIALATNLSGAISVIQDDPDSPDANWLTASGNNINVDVRVTMPTPTGDPTVGTDLQEFKAYVRQFDTGQTGTPKARIELWENGVLVRAGSDTDIIGSGQIIIFPWNANELATADGSLVECKIVGTKSGGSPSTRNTVEVGAVEWNVDYTAGGTNVTITPSVLNAAASYVGGIVLSLGLTVSPSSQVLISSVISPTQSLGLSVSPSVQTLVSSIISPTVTIGGAAVTVAPMVLSLAASLGNESLSLGISKTVSSLNITASMISPIVVLAGVPDDEMVEKMTLKMITTIKHTSMMGIKNKVKIIKNTS